MLLCISDKLQITNWLPINFNQISRNLHPIFSVTLNPLLNLRAALYAFKMC